MIELENRTIDDQGLVHYSEQGLIDFLYAGGNPNDQADFGEHDDVLLFNHWAEYFKEKKLKSNLDINHEENQSNWEMPEKYKELNLEEFFASRCETDEELERVAQELIMFKERDMEVFLRFLIYLVDFMEENKIVYGVGRGSSVASFCLFLIGIHQINSNAYGIPISEFLR